MQILGQRGENEEEGVEILRRSRERSSTRDDFWRIAIAEMGKLYRGRTAQGTGSEQFIQKWFFDECRLEIRACLVLHDGLITEVRAYLPKGTKCPGLTSHSVTM